MNLYFPDTAPSEENLLHRYRRVRARTAAICRHLETEDYVVQPMADVSPAKWHLGHTTWFFETFILLPHLPDYQIFHEDFSFIFNSYYETLGKRVLRVERGNLSRPTVAEVYRYREYVDEQIHSWLAAISGEAVEKIETLLKLGFNHEEQHQELLITDLKYTLGHNPLFPAVQVFPEENFIYNPEKTPADLCFPEGIYTAGHTGNSFCFDNELNSHKVFLPAFSIAPQLVKNADYLAFIESGGYQNFAYWLAEGWDWVQKNKIQSPLYWHEIDGKWWHYTFEGLQPVPPEERVCHVSFYEADAFARWSGKRLPTEFEWEVASEKFAWGERWEWTASAYLPYPGFQAGAGALGEYNGKFMSNQMVLRGASAATPPGHSRPTYRNFFHPDKRWQFTGIRLAFTV
jgi:ergothioneine biosynthesis protein EgtB